MAEQDFTSFAQLLDRIAGFCALGKTGTVMLVSDDNRMAQIHLDHGSIIFVLCRGRRGRDGLGIMRTIQRARMTLDRPSSVKNEPLEWSTEVVLDYLYGNISDLPAVPSIPELTDPVASPVAGAPASGALPAKRPAAPVRALTLSSDHRLHFERTMATYIGPMAAIVCADHFDKVSDLRTLTNKLAAEIPSAEQGAKFKADISRSLKIDI